MIKANPVKRIRVDVQKVEMKNRMATSSVDSLFLNCF